jgi:hypothetical protein
MLNPEEDLMRKFVGFGLVVVLFVFAGQALAAPPARYSEQDVTGTTQGNHELDCTVIRPWSDSAGPGSTLYPVIVWANGWNGGNGTGQDTTDGYKPGLIEWALDGPYIVIAANQWSATESDVLACLQWIVDQNDTPGSEYEGVVNTGKIGLAGHSQGGGAVMKAGDGEPNGFEITGVVGMNPYGPSWVSADSQDGPVMIITGALDENTPLSWMEAPWEGVQASGKGGVFAVLLDGDHSGEAWGPDGEDPTLYNFGRYQNITELWWRYLLKDNATAGRTLKRLLDKAPWETEYSFTNNFDL